MSAAVPSPVFEEGREGGRTQFVAVVPSPGHDARIPRMMLRRLAGEPLLRRAIAIARDARLVGSCVVLTDDEEVALLAERSGCGVLYADRLQGGLGDPDRLFTAARECVQSAGAAGVVLLRGNAPLLPSAILDQALGRLGPTEAVLAVSDGIPSPREADWDFAAVHGVFLAIGRDALLGSDRHALRMTVQPLHSEHSLHIGGQHEWWICERLLSRRRLVFVVAGYPAIGMGHVYRTLMLAHEFTDHDVHFVCTRDSAIALAEIGAHGYPVRIQEATRLQDDVLALQPDVVINDFLDTERDYVEALQAAGALVVSFEDLGSGAQCADLVINALLEGEEPHPRHRAGPEFFCLRDEFASARPSRFRPRAREILITFGGVDAADQTCHTIEELAPEIRASGLHATVVVGPGYGYPDRLEATVSREGAEFFTVARGTRRISDYMARADIAFSSAGRTVYELAHMRVPTVVSSANAKEDLHLFPRRQEGILHLGRHEALPPEARPAALRNLLDSRRRRAAYRALSELDLHAGKQRVIDEITSAMEQTERARPTFVVR